MMYDERFIGPMRQELTSLGVGEWRTAAAVDEVLAGHQGTALVIVNSMCGCAARNARPAVALARQHGVQPDAMFTVFAGNDADATRRVREYFTGYPPSSPAMGLMKDGKLVHMIERWQIEGRSAQEIARDLTDAFDRHCAKATA